MAKSVNIGNAVLLQMSADAGYQPAQSPMPSNEIGLEGLVSGLKAQETPGVDSQSIPQNPPKRDTGQAPGRS